MIGQSSAVSDACAQDTEDDKAAAEEVEAAFDSAHEHWCFPGLTAPVGFSAFFPFLAAIHCAPGRG
jgi:hypothetical protein